MDFTIELRFDFSGSEDEARRAGDEAARTLSSRAAFGHTRITAIFDENWEEI